MKLKPFHPLAQGLELTFMLNEGAGSIVYDATGHQHHGTGTNLAWGRDGLDIRMRTGRSLPVSSTKSETQIRKARTLYWSR